MVGVGDVLQHLLEAQRGDHDRHDHRHVRERERGAGQPGPGLDRLVGQRPLADQCADVEVGPPHRRRQHQAERGGDQDRPGDRELGDADADRHDRLAQRDDHDQAVPLGEVAGGGQPPPGRAAEPGADVVGDDRQRPERGLGVALGLRRDDQHDAAAGHGRREPAELAAEAGVLAGDQPEQQEVHGPHREVGERQDERAVQAARAVVERLGDAQRDHEQRRHPGQHRHLERRAPRRR